MRQTLFYLPAELFGLPVFGFGLALAVLVVGVLIAAAWRFSRTKKFDEDLWSFFGLLVVGGAVLVYVAPNVMEPRGFPIRGYGVCLLVAILSALGLVLHLAKRKGIPSDTIFTLCLWSVVSGLLGARLFYVTEYWREMLVFDPAGNMLFFDTFFNVVNIAKGGLVVYGSILGGMVGAIACMRLHRLPIFGTFDLMAPAMMLGIAIGRIGCLMNGCCFGGVCELPWAITFPEGSPAHAHQVVKGETFYDGLKFEDRSDGDEPRVVIREVQPGSEAEKAGLKPGMVLKGICGMVNGRPEGFLVRSAVGAFEVIHELQHAAAADSGGNLRFDVYAESEKQGFKSYFVGSTPSVVLPVHPTQIYSSIGAATICIVLLLLGRLPFFQRRDGLMLVAFLFFYSTGRFFIETIRTDEDSFLGTGLTVSQNVCILVFLAGIVLGTIIVRSPAKKSRN